MNTKTGEIHLMGPDETLDQLSKRLGVATEDLKQLEAPPVATCKKCGGRGAVPAGFGSKRFKPCDCTDSYETRKQKAYERKH